MIIKCSNCNKRYKIRKDRLPEGKIGTLNCPNCNFKIYLDFRKSKLNSENSNVSNLGTDNSLSKPKLKNKTNEKSLKAKILKNIDPGKDWPGKYLPHEIKEVLLAEIKIKLQASGSRPDSC